MRPRSIIRVNRPANREQQPGYRARVKKEAFGIYRPLTEASAEQVHEVNRTVAREIKSYFRQYITTPAELVAHVDLGVTFVPKSDMKRAMGNGLLQRGFQTARTIEHIEAHHVVEQVALPVRLGSALWPDEKRERKLGMSFVPGTRAMHELNSEAEVLRGMLRALKAGELAVREPDHISMFKYGTRRDGRDLSMEDKETVAGIMEACFQSAGLEEIVLGRLNMGESYSQPYDGGTHGA